MENKKQLRLWLTVVTVIFISVIFTTYIGLAKGGFAEEDILFQQFFYVAYAIGTTLGMVALVFIAKLITKGDSTYGDSFYFISPGEGVSPSFWKKMTLPQVFLGFLLLFSLFALYFVVSQQVTFTGVGQLEQQFTATDNLVYSNSLVPISENMGAVFFGAVVILLIRMLSRKFNLSGGLYAGLSALAFVASFILYAVGLHTLRYGFSESALFTVALFWGVGAIITLFTGSFVAFWAMHIANNLFVGLRTFFSAESAVAMSFGIIIFLSVIYGITYSNRLFGRKVNAN